MSTNWVRNQWIGAAVLIVVLIGIAFWLGTRPGTAYAPHQEIRPHR